MTVPPIINVPSVPQTKDGRIVIITDPSSPPVVQVVGTPSKNLFWARPYDLAATLGAAIAQGGASAQHDIFQTPPTATVLGNGRFAGRFGTATAVGNSGLNHTYAIDATNAEPGAFPPLFKVQALAITLAATANPADLGLGNGWKTICGLLFDDGDSAPSGFQNLTTAAPGFGVVAEHDGVTGNGAWVLQYANPGRPLQAPQRTVQLDDVLYPAISPTRFVWVFTNGAVGTYSTLAVYANGTLVDSTSWDPGASYTMPNYRAGKAGVWFPWIFGDAGNGANGAASCVVADVQQYYGPSLPTVLVS